MFVRYRQLTDELQVERESLHAVVTSSEVQLQQQSDEIQRLHDKVTVQTVQRTVTYRVAHEKPRPLATKSNKMPLYSCLSHSHLLLDLKKFLHRPIQH